MGTARRISRNTAYLAAAEMVSKVLQFVVMIYAARLLSQEDFGKFSFALSLSFIAMILADWGLNQLLVRTVARDKGGLEKYVANSIFLKIIFSALSGAFIVIVLNLFRYPQTTKGIVYIIWLFAILGTFTELLYSIFRAFERMEFDSLLKITRMAVLAAASITILVLGKGIVAFSVSFVAVEAGVVLMGSLIVWRVFSRGRLSFSLLDVAYMKSMLREALPFGLAILFGSLYFYISGFMLSVMEGDVAVALFSSAYNIALAVLFVPMVYTNAIYPVLSRYHASSREKLALLYGRSLKYLYIIGLPVSVGLYALSDGIVAFLYGAEYAAASLVLKIIAWYLFLKFVNFHLGITLSAIDRQKQRMIGQGITAGVNVLLNLILIPLYGIAGAAISTLVTEVVLFITYHTFVSKTVRLPFSVGGVARPLIAAVLMFGAVQYLHLHVLILAGIGAAVYATAIFLLRTFDKTDYSIMRGILSNGPEK